MSVQNQSRDIRFPISVVGLIITAFLLDISVEWLTDAIVSDTAPWIPTLGTVGQTILIYNWAVTMFAFVCVPVAAFWLGKKYGEASP